MSLHLYAALILLLQSLATWLVACSGQLCVPECYKSLQLTKESLEHLTAHLIKGLADPAVAGLQNHLAINEAHQEPCLKYLIGSVAISGRVDEGGLRAVHKLCNRESSHLSKLLKRLQQNNSLDTVALFVAEHIGHGLHGTNLGRPIAGIAQFERLIGIMMQENWNAMERLIGKTLTILEGDKTLNYGYSFIVGLLSAERQYMMMSAGELPLRMIDKVYCAEDDPLLKEIFVMARCSRNPNPDIRRAVASSFPSFRQYLADDSVVGRIKSPCPENIARLSDNVLSHVSRLMDIETLMYVMPLVCRAWRNLYWKTVMEDARIHDLYLLDLGHIELSDVHANLPWKYSLQNEAGALRYLGRCIEKGALGRAKPNYQLKCNLKEYSRAVIKGRAFIPVTGDFSTPYDAFTLLERVGEFLKATRSNPGKPEFFTDEEYEQAVYHLAYEHRLTVRLSESLMIDNIPRLFSIIKEDEELMRKLVDGNSSNFRGIPLALMVCGQTEQIPDKLARLIFSRTSLFRALAEPEIVPRGEYYSSIVESGILPRLVREYHDDVGIFPRFMISFILSFKNNPDMIDMIVALMAIEFIGLADSKMQRMRQCFAEIQFRDLMETGGHSTGDFEFFKGVVIRCRLM